MQSMAWQNSRIWLADLLRLCSCWQCVICWFGGSALSIALYFWPIDMIRFNKLSVQSNCHSTKSDKEYIQNRTRVEYVIRQHTVVILRRETETNGSGHLDQQAWLMLISRIDVRDNESLIIRYSNQLAHSRPTAILFEELLETRDCQPLWIRSYWRFLVYALLERWT